MRMARQHLGPRGVPCQRKIDRTSTDFEAFKKRGFSENSFPAVTVRTRRSIGFEAGTYDRAAQRAQAIPDVELPSN